MAEYLKVEGLADAKRAVEELTASMRKRIVRAALRDAAKPIIQQAKANAPMRTGLVRRRIVVTASKIKRGRNGEIGVYIKPRSTAKARRAKNLVLDPFYYRWVEADHYATGRAKRKNAPNARLIPGRAFLGRAFASRQRQALMIFQAAIKRRIDLANRRK